MRPSMIVLAGLLLVSRLVFAVDPKADVIGPTEAAKKVDEKVVLEMVVKSTGGRTNTYINSEEDFQAAANFTVFIAKDVKPKFQKAGIENPAEYFKGKTIRVTGTVTVFEKKPRIAVTEPEQITVVMTK
jgi:DNA/RNA endonuclease YhcR with UshA esterase domain